MALGVIKIIPASNHTEVSLTGGGTAGGGQPYPTIKVLNPNDGVVYVAQNRDALGVGYGSWDWKIPSQSYGMLPGPFQSVGLYYLDQSGAGRQGEITIYPSQQKLDDPIFLAIGRALQAQTTSLDITEGAQPANPGSGILRVWADGSDVLHGLNGAGTDELFISTRTALTGALVGSVLPNTAIQFFTLSNSAIGTLSQTNLWTDIPTSQITVPAGQYFVIFTCRYITGANASNGAVSIVDSTAGTSGTPQYVATPQVAQLANSQSQKIGIGVPTFATPKTIKFQGFADATGCTVDGCFALIWRVS